ncbi:DNA methyltransferase [Candidatus Magnetobacterium casense]|uniref:DNA methylase N-4/N-6 domain-containing protein n=1 Tax=Candidatus Magnetobacterium casense TaxID=1455061 RepID=A0ABS6S3V8_9BACT|nr:DNA methyltransferase [Candidatus Magnetobacterium casensis]MBV6343312.1 hypothetical protein [Candidatus Magnetobacterium casensis]
MGKTSREERKQIRAHAVTLRKQGWTERAIAHELNLSKTAIHKYLVTAGVSGIRDHKAPMVTFKPRTQVTKGVEFHSFLGKVEDFQTELRFPLIIADPPWNISVENSMQFTFTDTNGKPHTPMKRDFGSWDFMGDDASYLSKVEVWLQKLFDLATANTWCWFWCSYRYLSHINNSARTIGWEPKGWYVWAKTNVPPLTATINGTLLPSLEPCLIFRKGKGQLRVNKTGHANYRELPMVPSKERLQDTENIAAKPIAILSDFIEWASEPGDWVLDAFAGTGSTSRAALMKRRNAFAVESDKRQLTLLKLHIEEQYGTSIIHD